MDNRDDGGNLGMSDSQGTIFAFGSLASCQAQIALIDAYFGFPRANAAHGRTYADPIEVPEHSAWGFPGGVAERSDGAGGWIAEDVTVAMTGTPVAVTEAPPSLAALAPNLAAAENAQCSGTWRGESASSARKSSLDSRAFGVASPASISA